MPRFSPGLASQNHLIRKLEGFGCQLHEEELDDHIHKLDCILYLLPEYPRLLREPLGVQITTRIGDYEKRKNFWQHVTKNPFAPKNIYIELDSELDLDRGGAFLVLAAITNFLTNTRLKDLKVVGVQVNADLTYNFFDLTVAPPPLLTNGQVAATTPDNHLSGDIDHYDPTKGFGYINGTDGARYFFHVQNTREKLATLLSSHDGLAKLRVRFTDAGLTPGKRFHQAKDVYQIVG